MRVSCSLPVGSQISALIFDLDGTLYLAGRLRRAMAWRLLRASCARPLATWRDWRILNHYRSALEHLRALPEPLATEQLRLASEWSGVPADRAAQSIAYWMQEAPLALMHRCLRPGVVDLLAAARHRGICLGLLSDYPAKEKLAAAGLDSFFSVVLSAQDNGIGVFKPSPKGLLRMLQQLAVAPERAVYIGDRPSVDGEAAHRAGIAAVILSQSPGSGGTGWVGAPDIAALRKLLSI